MQLKPIISVIVPVFNAEVHIEECIRSILAQQFDQFELILINDGSTDLSGTICDRIAREDCRIRVIHQKNAGVAIARAEGIRNASGEWIAFADADDRLYPNNLALLYDTAVKGSYDIVKGSIINTRGKKFIHRETTPFDGISFLKSILKDTTFAYIYAAIYKKSIFDDDCICKDRSIRIGEDVLTNMLLSKRITKAKNITDIIYYYRTNPESVMSQKIPHPDYWKRYYESFAKTVTDLGIIGDMTQIQIIKQIKAFLEPEIPFDSIVFSRLQKEISHAEKEYGFKNKYACWFRNPLLFRSYKTFKRIHLQLKSLKHTRRLSKREIIY